MKKLVAAFAAAAIAACLVPLALAGGERTKIATAVNACSELVSWGAIPASEYDACRADLRHGADFSFQGTHVRAQCAFLEGLVGGWPFTFHEGEGDPFPDLTATNVTECTRALYTFHTIEANAFSGPPQPGPTAGPPNVANAPEACRTLVSWGAIGEDDIRGCLAKLAGGANFSPGPGAPTFVQRCALLEQGVTDPFPLQVSYPFTFHSGLHDIFPDLTAHNRDQCSRALYVFHTLEEYLGGLGG